MGRKPTKSTTKKKKATTAKSIDAAKRLSSDRSTKSLELLDIVLFFLAIFLLIALLSFDPSEGPGSDVGGRTSSFLGQAGHTVAYWTMHLTFGTWGALSLPLVMFILLFGRWSQSGFRPNRWIFSALSVGFISGFGISVIRFWKGMDQDVLLTGVVPLLAVIVTDEYLGMIGTILLTVAVVMMLAVILFDRRPTAIIIAIFITFPQFIFKIIKNRFNSDQTKEVPITSNSEHEIYPSESETLLKYKPIDLDESNTGKIGNGAERSKEPPFEISEPLWNQSNQNSEEEVSPQLPKLPFNKDTITTATQVRKLPPIDLLDPPPADQITVDPAELEENARRLEDKLRSMKITARVIRANPGPVITRYDLEPAPNVKIARIANLADDLAMTLRSQGVRILAPIPGEAAVGIEIPNRHPETVYMSEIVASKQFLNATSPLTIALGKDANGEVFCVDLAKMPHLLIAGATGSGKSVCINSILTSLLYRTDPKDVRIALVDPKKVELSLYSRLEHQHLIAPPGLGEIVVTEPENAVKLLRSIHIEMEQRYDLLKETGVRAIDEYNDWVDKLVERQEKTLKLDTTSEDLELPERMPYIVVIIDELADLMLTVRREFEELVVRLAQMARAVGIHLIIATQRPSVDVVTGLIKANFPSRIAFKVAQKVDSRTIIDAMGAHALLGRGDMLFMGPGTMFIKRLHGALVTTNEVERVVEHVRSQPPVDSTFELPDPETLRVKIDNSSTGSVDSSGYSSDELFIKAAQTVVNSDQGSVSLLQRRLRVGYARAARLIDELEQAGVVGPFDGSKARQVLMDPAELNERFGVSE